MMMEMNSDLALFHSLLQNHFNEVNGADSFQKLRSKAWIRFEELGLPTRKSEVFHYINLRRLFSQKYSLAQDVQVSEEDIKPLIYPESQKSFLVFVNGRYQPQLSVLDALPKKASVIPLNEALKTFGTFLNHQWGRTLKEEKDPFVALNAALHSQGAFIYLPPKTVCETPVQVLNIVKQSNSLSLVLPRVHLFAGAQAQMNLLSTLHVDQGVPYFFNGALDFALEEEAHIHCTQIALNSQEDIWHFEALRANLKRNSSLKSVAITNGGAGVRHDYKVALAGENAEAELNGVWMLDNKREAHVHVLMEHQAPHCRSLQLFKGVLNGISKSSFEGKIYVHQDAQKTEAFQSNHNLILSDHASAQSKPNLEIFADDVKASHGATVGQLDKEQLFYMKTRGIPETVGKKILIEGFCKDVIEKITCLSLYEDINEWTKNYMNQG